MNAIRLIAPYRHLGMWVFDDPGVGLVQEPFVAGADTMIDRVVEGIPNAEKGFRLLFSAEDFPGRQLRLDWIRGELSGNVYFSEDLQMEGWLCPALLKYFAAPPRRLFVQVSPLPCKQPDSSTA